MPKRLLFLVTLLAATLVPSAAVAASRPTPTTGISYDVTFSPTPYSYATTTLHVTNARLVMQEDGIHACWQMTVQGEPFFYDPAVYPSGPSVAETYVSTPLDVTGACWSVQALRTNYIPIADCETGTVNLQGTGTPGAVPVLYTGVETGQVIYVYPVPEVPVLTADTREERRAVCQLARAATSGVSNERYVQLLNETLALLSTV